MADQEMTYTLDMLSSDDSDAMHAINVAQAYFDNATAGSYELSQAQFVRITEEIERSAGIKSAMASMLGNLAEINASSFSTLESGLRGSHHALSKEVQAVGSLVKDCHNDVINKMNELQKSIQCVNTNVVGLGQNLEVTIRSLIELRAEFDAYVMKDKLVNNVQLAKQDLVQLNQRLESEFGHNKELRRTAVGILQSNDLNVRAETILTRAEELCIQTPNYWLAPALVALASWIAASREMAVGSSYDARNVQEALAAMEGMLKEAYRRECSKTALFFGLVNRRANDISGANEWFNEYIRFQDPHAVDHTCTVLLNIYAGGLMGHGEEERSMLAVLSGWLRELTEEDGGSYRAELISDWRKKCRELVALSNVSADDYPALREFCPQTWPALRSSMERSSLPAALSRFLEEQLDVRPTSDDDLAVVDTMITDLVSGFDADELPIRREQEYQQLIVDLEGKADLARTLRTVRDDILTETKSFVSVLSDAARNSRLTRASDATRAVAIRLQLPYIKQAFALEMEECHAETPEVIAIEIGDFHAETVDGTNEDEVIDAFLKQVNEQERAELEGSKTGMGHQVAIFVGAVAAVVGLILCCTSYYILGAPLLVGGAIAAISGLMAGPQARKKQESIRERMAAKRRHGVLVIRKIMAEVRAWRRLYSENDSLVDGTVAQIDALAPAASESNVAFPAA